MSENNTLKDFEASLSELERIVAKMEQGDMSLEESLRAFEKGVKLTKLCQQTLKQAEQRVIQLTQEADDATKPNQSTDAQELI